MRSAVSVGRYFGYKFRRNAHRFGYYRTAKQMRKLGVPLVVTRLVLLGKL